MSNVFAAEAPSEQEVKAAFLLNFTKFIEWPESAFAAADAPFSICIPGKDPVGKSLDEIVAGESAQGHPLTVRRLSEPGNLQACQVLVLDSSQKETHRTLSELRGGILTVGDGANFTRDGGMIGFVIENRRVRFVINQRAAEQAMLRLSSRLLNVAKAVEK